jgi:type 1 glutamine amidotransferase
MILLRRRYLALAAVLCAVAVFSLNGPVSLRGAEETKGEKPIKALLVIGGCCHDYAKQKTILSEGISARANVQWTIIHEGDPKSDHKMSVFENPDWAKGYDVVVHDECCSAVKDPAFIEQVLKPHKEGFPAVILHCGMHCFRSEGYPKMTPWFEFTGLPSTGHGKQLPISIGFVDKDHPITKGLEDWTTVNEELYNNFAGGVLDTAHPLARGKQGDADCVVTWTNSYNGKARVFATTLGHNNATVADPRYLDLVTRGLLWSVNKLDDKHFKSAAK